MPKHRFRLWWPNLRAEAEPGSSAIKPVVDRLQAGHAIESIIRKEEVDQIHSVFAAGARWTDVVATGQQQVEEWHILLR
jgi:hypothetical protein